MTFFLRARITLHVVGKKVVLMGRLNYALSGQLPIAVHEGLDLNHDYSTWTCTCHYGFAWD
jgi:hypothetical protein